MLLMPMLDVHPVTASAGFVGVALSAVSGIELGGLSIGVLTALISAVALILSVAASNRKRRADAADALRAEYDRGRADEKENTAREAKRADFYQGRYFGLAESKGARTDQFGGEPDD